MPSLRVHPPHGSRLAQPLLALLALVALFLFAAPTLAVEPPRLDGAITDRSGVIRDETESRDAFPQRYTATTTVSCRFTKTVANLSTQTGSTGRVILTTTLLP